MNSFTRKYLSRRFLVLFCRNYSLLDVFREDTVLLEEKGQVSQISCFGAWWCQMSRPALL